MTNKSNVYYEFVYSVLSRKVDIMRNLVNYFKITLGKNYFWSKFYDVTQKCIIYLMFPIVLLRAS